MLRRHTATASLALATLLGVGGPAAAEATPRDSAETAPQRLRLAPRPVRPLSSPTTAATPATPIETGPMAEPTEAWIALVDARLDALAVVAEARATQTPSSALASAELLDQLERIATRLDDEAAVGIAVRELATGAPVFEWEAELSLNPASNQKLLTATAALELLGSDYRFETRVLRDGDALVLVGEGDPSLQVEDLSALADQVAAAVDLGEIHRIIVDDSAFSARRFGPGYDPEGPGVAYMAPSGALSLQFNTVEIQVHGAKEGKALRISVSPPCEHLEIRTTATGGPGALSIQTWEDGQHTVVDVRGHLRAGARFDKRRRISEPGLYTGSAFATLLESRGAEALRVERSTSDRSADLVASHRSEPLPEVLEAALAYSNNFSTEQLLRTLAWRMTGEPGSWENGRRALERYWIAASLPVDDLVFENASGLSYRGRITAAALTQLLAFATRDGSAAAALWTVLPVAGREGTLRGRLRRSDGRVRAKTGTLRGASALSGIVETKGGRRLGFSILVNGPVSPVRSRRLQDKVVMALVEHGASD